MTTDPTDPPHGASSTRVVGLLGGVASGKSTVARILAGGDGDWVDADRLAHEVLASDEVTRAVSAAFGTDVLGPDGRPDRASLARRVFGDPEARARLEGWIHPRVRATIRARLERARAAGLPVIVLDIPLLLENEEGHHLADECDAIVFVDAPLPHRDARAREARGWEQGEVERREAAQLPLEEKRAAATHVVTNGGSLNELERAAAELRSTLLAGTAS